MDELGSPIFLGRGIQTPCGSSGNLPTFLDRRGAFKWWFLPFPLWKQDWFLHVIVFVLSWLQAFQHLVHLLLSLHSKCQARSPLWEGWKSWCFCPIKPEQLGPTCAAYSLTTKLNFLINAISLWMLVVVPGFDTGKYHWRTKALEVSGIWLW